MFRLFVTSAEIFGKEIKVADKNQIHHIKDVLRLQLNEEIIAIDEKANRYKCLIKEILPRGIILEVLSKSEKISEQGNAKITLACAIPKKSKFDDIVDRLTQIGVDRIIPMRTQRVIIKFDKSKEGLRLERWKKIALNASQQSQREALPIVEPLKDIKDVLKDSANYDLKLIPALIDERKPIKLILNKKKPENILVLIGPEGDFTQEEINLAKSAGFIPVSLGGLVLRVETAAVSVASFLKFSLDN